MNRRKLIGWVPGVVLALGAIAAAGASAALPEFSTSLPNTFRTEGGAATFEQKGGVGPVPATSSEGQGEMASFKEGTLNELFLGTTAPLSGSCTGLDDSVTGAVLEQGRFKLGYLDAAKSKPGLALTLKPETHFECEKTLTLVTVRGCVVGELSPKNSKTTTFTLTLGETKGLNAFTQILNATNTAFEPCSLSSETNGGTFKQSGQATTLQMSWAKAIELVA